MKRQKLKDSRMLKNAHEMAVGLYTAGIIDAKTMHEFTALCIPQLKVWHFNNSSRQD